MLGTLEITLLFANITIGSFFVIYPWSFVTAGLLVYTGVAIAVCIIYTLVGRMVLE